MALAKDTPRRASPTGGGNFQVVNGATAYLGAKLALCTPTHGTSASRGRVSGWTGVAGEFPIGWSATSKTVGDTSANPIPNVGVLAQDVVVDNLAVAGLASSDFQADNLKYVYATADGTFTLTRPSAPNRTPCGMVICGKTASVCDVLMFGAVTQAVIAACGSNIRTIPIACVGVGITGSGNLATGIKLSGHGKILETYAVCLIGPTDADVDIDANLEIGGTNVTGGVIELIAADVAGDNKAGTAITAANEFHDGDLLDIEGVVNTAGTASDPGLYQVYITVEYLPGL